MKAERKRNREKSGSSKTRGNGTTVARKEDGSDGILVLQGPDRCGMILVSAPFIGCIYRMWSSAMRITRGGIKKSFKEVERMCYMATSWIGIQFLKISCNNSIHFFPFLTIFCLTFLRSLVALVRWVLV
uniref:Uncharacterized protein n=1 Tax=Manihot esculenta TaxID=3983 RepID=A0A251KVB1_MANES